MKTKMNSIIPLPYLAIALLLFSCNKINPVPQPECEHAKEAVFNMKVGLNMNDTMDNHTDWEKKGVRRQFPLDFEKMTLREVMTQATFDETAKAGFNAVRVPITWYPHMNRLNNNVDLVWMNRVEQVVKMILNTGMYCIINIHHDAGSKDTRWLIADESVYPEMSTKFKHLWKQIAERFKDYDEKLLFESFNEIIDTKKSWGATTKEAYNVINKLNQDFVDVVRSTGGYNKTRNLVVSPYAAGGGSALDSFKVPEDEKTGHIIVQVHSYLPHNFASWSLTNEYPDFHDEADTPGIVSFFTNLKPRLEKLGIPCILSEYGAADKKNEDDRSRQAYIYTSLALQNGILPLYWYNPMTRRDGSTDCSWTYPKLRDAILNAANEYWNR